MDIVLPTVFQEMAVLLVMAAVGGLVATFLRQPLLVAFLMVGILAGPSVLGIARSGEQIHFLSELGVALLLMLVGIKLDVGLVRSLGAVSLLTGLGQVLFTSVFGFLLALAMGFDAVTSVYMAVALTFSSTIIIVKLLSDKREIDSLHGRIALGFLIVQDIVVVVAMMVLSAVGVGTSGEGSAGDVARLLASGVALLVGVLLFARYLADPLTRMLARVPELLMCFAVAMAAAFAAAGDLLGFGKELGGLLAGVSLASTPYRDAIAARLAPLRDFLLLFFFVALGGSLDLGHMAVSGPAALAFSVFVLVGNPLIVLAIMGAMGYRKRTGFLAGLTVAQISEFSLIFMAMGVSLGHVSVEALGLVTMVGLVTITVSTYMILWSHRLYAWFEPLLAPFERHGTPRETLDIAAGGAGTFDTVLFGLGRYGGAIAQRLASHGRRVLGVDFNPEVVRERRAAGMSAVYGDSMDPELLAALPLGSVRWVVSTTPSHETGVTHQDARYTLIHALRELNFGGGIAVACHHASEVEPLRRAGADLVLEPFQDAADEAVNLLESDETPVRLDEEVLEGQREIGE